MDISSDQPTYTSVNIEDPEPPPLATLITKELQGLDPVSRDVTIYRVPRNLRQVNEKAYTPQMVSIGPFHRKKEELQPWEEHKLRYLQAFLDRTYKSLQDCIELVKGLEAKARACYRERIDMTSNEFVKMMLLDSCFIIEAIWRSEHNPKEKNDYLSTPELISLVQRDMILLENQIPFFVIQGLFCLGFNKPGEDEFLELTISYFSDLVLTKPDTEIKISKVKKKISKVKKESGLKIEHFTDLLRICHLPTNLKKQSTSNYVRIPNAASLHKAGMKFKIGTSKCLLDIEYENGLLEMPKFNVEDQSECLLRNIIALETCHYPFDSYIIDYVFFMDMLIDTPTDVDLLIQKGIIMNYLSDSAAVASLFNNIGMEISLFSPYYFRSISNGMNAYYNFPWHEWKATFKRDYCRTPWMCASTVAAIILLVLTLIQTICSIISLF